MRAEEASERAALVAEARSWIGTPYHSGAKIKKAGADCLTIIVACFENAGLIQPYKIPHYPHDWHMHRDDERYLEGVREFCDEVEGPALPADVLLFRFGRSFSHGAIVTAWPMILHAFVRRPVTEDDLTRERWLTTIGENVAEKGRPRPMKVMRLRRWCA